jgi:autotransporter-associated beta strand protein
MQIPTRSGSAGPATTTEGGGDGIINLNSGGTLITSRQFLRNATAVANNTGSGTFNFNGGLLQIDAPQASALDDLFSEGITLNIAGGARIDTNGFDVMITRDIGSTGSGSLEKLGSGMLTLSGTNTYTGNTLITAGTLEVATNDAFADTSTVRIESGASLSLTHGGTDQVAALIINNVSQLPGLYTFGGGSLDVVPVAGNDYAEWASANNVSGGAGGDSDNDGVKNLIEYALIDGGERGSYNAGTRTITFNKRGAPYGGDITYTIESSTNLTSWTPLATPPVVEDASKIEYTLPAPSPGQPKVFTRLRVSETP